MTDVFLMCNPKWFGVSYVINPWMEGNENNVISNDAILQWTELQSKLALVSSVIGIKPARSLPDMVFTANGALIYQNKAVLSRFKHQERQDEEIRFNNFLLLRGFRVLWLPSGIPFEGAGDALFCRRHPSMLWMGYGHRSDVRAAPIIADYLKVAVQPLRLIDDRFYHLDTCFCPLTGGTLMYYPQAFDEEALAKIRAMIPPNFRVEVSEEDALNFACNAVNVGQNIFVNKMSSNLEEILTDRGFIVHQTPLTEFMKAGGSAKCLTLKLNEE